MPLGDQLESGHVRLVVIFHDANSIQILQITSLFFTLKKFTYFLHLNGFVYVMTVKYTCSVIIYKSLKVHALNK